MKSNDANIDSLSWLAALLKVVCECHGRVEASSRWLGRAWSRCSNHLHQSLWWGLRCLPWCCCTKKPCATARSCAGLAIGLSF